MMSKDNGLEHRFHVTKVNNPTKEVDAIVLEFDDPIAAVGIVAWAKEMKKKGYEQCHDDTMKKLNGYIASAKILANKKKSKNK